MADVDPFAQYAVTEPAAQEPTEDPFAQYAAPEEIAVPLTGQPAVDAPVVTGEADAATKALAGAQGLTRYMGGDFLREGGRRLVEGGAGLLGASPDVIADYNPFQSREEVLANKAAAPGLAAGGEALGAVGGALATGGFGGARAGAMVAKKLAPIAAKSTIARLGAAAAALGVEGEVGNAAMEVGKHIDEAFVTGNYDGLAERALAGLRDNAGKGALTNVAFGTGLGLLKKGYQGLLNAGASDFVSGRAFKSVLGRTNARGVKLADKRIPGGAEAVGRAMLDEGIVTPGASYDDIAENLVARRAAIGEELGVKRAEIGASDVSGADLWKRVVDDVLDPLAKDPNKARIGRALEAKLEDVKTYLNGADGAPPPKLTLDDITKLRQGMDDVLKWESLGNDATMESHRGVRRALNDGWMDAAEEAAAVAGKPELVKQIKELNSRYAKVALADDLAREAQQFALSNRVVSLSDYVAGAGAGGIGTALASGNIPAAIGAGAASAGLALGNKIVRDRGNQFIAGSLDALSKRLAKTQARVGKAALLPKLLAKPGTAAATAGVSALRQPVAMPALSFAGVDSALKQADELADPNSEASGELASTVNELELELGPEMAQAVASKAKQRAEFLREKAGPMPAPSVFGGQPGRDLDDDTKGTLKRYLDAVDDPAGAIQRLSDGDATPEDQDTLSTLYPSMLQEWREKAVRTLGDLKDKPDYERQLEIAQTLGLSLTPDSAPQSIAYWQELSGVHAAEHEARKQAAQAPTGNYKPPASASKGDRSSA